MSTIEAVEALVGTRYREGGRSPEEGFDCRTVVWWGLTRVLGLPVASDAFWLGDDLAETEAGAEAFLARHAAQWTEHDRLAVAFARPGDVAHIRMPVGEHDHLALCVADGLFLTTSRETGVVLLRAGQLSRVQRLLRYAPAS